MTLPKLHLNCNLSVFSVHELDLAIKLLNAYKSIVIHDSALGALPPDWNKADVRLAISDIVCEVFLVNANGQLLAWTPYGLMMYYIMPSKTKAGTLDKLLADYMGNHSAWTEQDVEFLKTCCFKDLRGRFDLYCSLIFNKGN